jgi:enoyl-CoA hydratase
MLDAMEAERLGIVARVVPVAALMTETHGLAAKIASFSQPVVARAKRLVNESLESDLASGLRLERKMFYQLFDLEDQKEGMTAFLEKRKAVFNNR